MKIKKVEIQAFRAYSKVTDCTFDFTLNDKSTADFISIYAPNGFGKTSFYDAVEWCYTNNIYRFVRRDALNRAYAQDEKQLKFELDESKSPLRFIRNKNSPDSLPGFVRIHLANPDAIKERKIPSPIRIDSSDYGFDEKITENHFFRDVILSQESIDAFLKEDQPEGRYNKFMALFGDKELDNAYSNILYLIKINTEKLNRLEDELNKIQLELPLDMDDSILEKVNAVVDELNGLNVSVNRLAGNSNDSELLAFSNTIADKILALEAEATISKSTIEKVKQLKLKVNEYNESRNSALKLSTEIDKLNSIKATFNTINTSKNLIVNCDTKIKSQLAIQKELQSIVSILPEYFDLLQIIRDNESFQKSTRADLIDAQNKLNQEQTRQEALRKRKNDSLRRQNDLFKRHAAYPGLAHLVTNSTTEVEQLEAKINELRVDFNRAAQDTNSQEANIRQLENEIAAIKKYEFSEITLSDFELLPKVNLIHALQQNVIQIRKELDTLEAESSMQLKLQDDIRRIIILGTELVDRQKSDHCPLCSSSFESHESLSKSILNNPLLSDRLQILFSTKSEKEKELQQILNEISLLREQIISSNSEKLALAREKLQVLTRDNAQIQINLELESKNLNVKQAALNATLSQLGGKTLLQYSTQITNELDILSQQFEILEAEESECSANIDQWIKTINELNQKLASAESEILKSKSTITYLKVNQYITDHNLTSIDSTYIGLVEEQTRKQLSSLQNTLSMLQAELDENVKHVDAQNLSSVENELVTYLAQLKQLEADQRSYISLIDEIFPNRKFGIEGEIIAENLSTRKALETALLDNLIIKINLLKRAEEYKKNVLPFLTYNRNMAKRDELNSEINFYRNTVGKELLNEKEKLAAFIDTQIQSFFYEDLINKLYQKIDPHPEYRQIKFKCDFTGDKPKMNVFVNDDGKTFVIPNLYFSTAQMNILSLSIFLAKALNATDDDGNPIDCIFIDDPIQSMDSINILSTIDLFRSIVNNLNKQIILSTHDENFHILLQKKIPSTIYRAKYIELETFGIVKS
ncbi:AAA family ATPase [Flavisolibacter tropicus]|uniref:AAA family ATPase n=1 Tax=Flavisolibacter tropicus TaxID=1492898 RepID=UPI00083216B5|nr:AAA family ATPase [Flavisolibacter tropicus]